jgi:hypothetical protein
VTNKNTIHKYTCRSFIHKKFNICCRNTFFINCPAQLTNSNQYLYSTSMKLNLYFVISIYVLKNDARYRYSDFFSSTFNWMIFLIFLFFPPFFLFHVFSKSILQLRLNSSPDLSALASTRSRSTRTPLRTLGQS